MARSASLGIALLQKQKEQQVASKEVRALHKQGRTQVGASAVGIETSKAARSISFTALWTQAGLK